MLDFIQDAQRIVLANRHFVDLAPLQIYSSAMIFAPRTSVVRNVCSRVPSWIRTCPITPPMWSLELQKLEGHTEGVSAVAFSQDGSLLASASADQTVRLWNPATGQETQKLRNVGYNTTLVFTNDDKILVFDHGTMLTGKESLLVPTSELFPNQTLIIEGNWIRQDGYNLLWLPQEYRDSCTTFHDNTFAFGLYSGRVSFLKLDFLS